MADLLKRLKDALYGIFNPEFPWWMHPSNWLTIWENRRG